MVTSFSANNRFSTTKIDAIRVQVGSNFFIALKYNLKYIMLNVILKKIIFRNWIGEFYLIAVETSTFVNNMLTILRCLKIFFFSVTYNNFVNFFSTKLKKTKKVVGKNDTFESVTN